MMVFCAWNSGPTLKSAITKCDGIKGCTKTAKTKIQSGENVYDLCTEFCRTSTDCLEF